MFVSVHAALQQLTFLFCFQSKVLHSSHRGDQEPLMQQAPPSPGSSAQPDRLLPSSKTPNGTSQREGGDGKSQRKVEEEEKTERRTFRRSLLPPQPSKLRLFLSHTCSSAPGSPKTRSSAPCDSGSEVKLNAFSSNSSRLPKPKNHWGSLWPADPLTDPDLWPLPAALLDPALIYCSFSELSFRFTASLRNSYERLKKTHSTNETGVYVGKDKQTGLHHKKKSRAFDLEESLALTPSVGSHQ